jgi:hypothetical protein
MFYGWRIVSVVFLTNFISTGLVFYSYGVLFKALVADFGGSRLGVATGLAVMNLAIAAASPYLGRRVDHGSIRRILSGGAWLMAIGFLAASRIDALWQFYLIMGTLWRWAPSCWGRFPARPWSPTGSASDAESRSACPVWGSPSRAWRWLPWRRA